DGVRIQRESRRVSKSFRRSKYNGWEEAKQDAIEFRDQWLQDWENTARNADNKIPYQNSVTGELGVHRASDHGYVSLGVSYKDEDGQQHLKHFRVGRPEDEDYEKKYKKQMKQAKAFRDKVNMKRFGVRWVNYKRRKKFMDK